MSHDNNIDPQAVCPECSNVSYIYVPGLKNAGNNLDWLYPEVCPYCGHKNAENTQTLKGQWVYVPARGDIAFSID